MRIADHHPVRRQHRSHRLKYRNASAHGRPGCRRGFLDRVRDTRVGPEVEHHCFTAGQNQLGWWHAFPPRGRLEACAVCGPGVDDQTDRRVNIWTLRRWTLSTREDAKTDGNPGQAQDVMKVALDVHRDFTLDVRRKGIQDRCSKEASQG